MNEMTYQESLSEPEIKEAVAEAAKVLDIRRPSWPLEIDISKLDMGNSCLCILGQLYERFSYAVKSLKDMTAFCGEICTLDTSILDTYQKYWIEEIKQRLPSNANTV